MKLEQPEQSTHLVNFQETIFSQMSMLYQKKCKQVDGSLHCRHEAKSSESENSPHASIQNRKECERLIDTFLKSTVKHLSKRDKMDPMLILMTGGSLNMILLHQPSTTIFCWLSQS